MVPGTLMTEGLKKKGTTTRSWVLLDFASVETILDMDKYAIMDRIQIRVRILDPLLSYPSAILGREHAIVLNLEALLRDPFDDNVIHVVEELRRRLHPVTSQMQGDGKENLSGLHDLEVPDEYGMPLLALFAIAHAEGITSNLAWNEAAYIMNINPIQESNSFLKPFNVE